MPTYYNPIWRIILDGEIIAYGDKFNELPFYDDTISRDKSEWRIYTILDNPARLQIVGNDINDYYRLLDTQTMAKIREFCVDFPKDRVEFLDPDQPHKSVDDSPFESFRNSAKGRRKYEDTFWYRNLGRVIWESGQGISSILTPIVEGIVMIILRIIDLVPLLLLMLANIVGFLATSTTHILSVFIQSFHYMINAHSQIRSTDLETKRKYKGTVHTNRTNREIFDMMNRSMPVTPKVGSDDTSSGIMNVVGPLIFLACIFGFIMIIRNN